MSRSTSLGEVVRRRESARIGAAILAIGAALFLVGAGTAEGSPTPPGAPAACTAAPSTSSSGSAFSASETLCRVFSDQGVVDQRNFSLTVSETAELRNRQVIDVSWTGAQPTGGLVANEQNATAAQQEYPVVLMECRGTSATLSPATCWTSTADERTGIWDNGNPLWSLDAFGNQPANQFPIPYPASCRSVGFGDQYWLPFDAADGTVYPVGPSGCDGIPSEMSGLTGSQQDQSIIPSDTTYAATNLQGSGTDNFTVMTTETNTSLGCTINVACSLVVIPIEGISCSSNPDEGSPWDQCEAGRSYAPGSANNGDQTPSAAITGSYWWSASNWNRRISVPLTFAEPTNACVANSSAPQYLYGSELMVQATSQWNPYFCLNPKLFNVTHVQAPEPESKFLLQDGAIDAAIQGEPPPQPHFFTTPTVQAPIAVTGFAIAYDIDQANGTQYTSLQLDPRLLAKLLTESYPGDPNIAAGDTRISGNPLSIFDDPEFKALNPNFVLPSQPTPQSGPAAVLFSIFTQSDVIWALTSYINDDPEARAWLNGQPDPWGMVVNPAYKGIQLPVESWTLLDKSTDGPDYNLAQNPCLAQAQPGQRTPDRPLLDNPEATWAQVAYNLQFSIAVSEENCTLVQNAEDWSEIGTEPIGSRFLIGVVPLASAVEYGLPTAGLQSYVSPSTPSPFSPLGRLYVSPTNSNGQVNTAALQAAVALMQPDSDAGTWVMPYGDFPSDPATANAYPGTMLMSADIPTKGLSADSAQDYGEYLSFAATTGQTPGFGVGELPPGYLPMTAANGLTDQLAYTEAAAKDVASQNGEVPPLIPGPSGSSSSSPSGKSSPSSSSSSEASSSSGLSGEAASGGSGGSGTGSGSASSSSPNGSSSGAGGSGSAGGKEGTKGKGAASDIVPAAATSPALSFGSGIGGLALPLALLIALIGGVSVASVWWRGRKQAKS